ncbi:hypothetical protein ABBQ38_011057 [Trebouxia sp. C0009 RCD-2024]
MTSRHISIVPSLAASVKVPSMGESIEEGTISAILKQEGDAVEMDEAVFQIETDKVTVDVRASEAGVINKIMVKQDDTVKVGQELADIGSGSGAKKSEDKPKDKAEAPTASAPVEDDKQKLEDKPISEEPMGGEPSPKDTAVSSSSQPESSPKTDSRSNPSEPSKFDSTPPQPGAATVGPSIRFPLRVTPDGQRISDLPAEEQDKLRKQDAASAQQPKTEQQSVQSAAPAQQAPKSAATEPNKFVPYAGQDRGTKLSQARVLSAKEIEIIELGGADP